MRLDPDEIIAWQELPPGKDQQLARVRAERALISAAQVFIAEDGLPVPLLRGEVNNDRRQFEVPISFPEQRATREAA